MAKMVNTVCGPVLSDDLGVTLAHEHLLFGYPGYQGDTTIGCFDRATAVKDNVDAINQLKANYKLKTIIDATPNECGRDPEFLKEVAEKTGINILCATGYYFEGEGAPSYFSWRSTMCDIVPEIYDMMNMEVTKGIAGTGIKAGIIKLASSKDQITNYEQAFFKAAAKISKKEGTPIITHTQDGTMGPEQAELLISEGADPKRIQIGHMEGNLDLNYQIKTLKQGVYIAFDRFGLQVIGGNPMDSQRVETILALIKEGYGDRILISHDYIQQWLGRPIPLPTEAMEIISNWNFSNIFTNVVPALKQGGASNEQIQMLLVENPKRLYGF